jgi:nicotinic acetylcholine receptor alpha-9
MALITASTALTIMVMNIHFCGAEARPVPHWARVVFLKYMSKTLFVYDVGESCLSPRHSQERDHLTKVYSKLPDSALKTARNKDLSTKKEMNKLLNKELGSRGESPQDTESYCAQYEVLTRNIEYIAKCLKDHTATSSKGSEWKKVAKVIDRFFMWIFFIMVFVMTILIIARAD